jgi:hypothetical protein
MPGYSKNAQILAPGTYVYALDWMTNPFNVSWQVLVNGGATASYTLNSTMDPINPEIGVGYGVSVAPNPNWTQINGTAPATTSGSGTITGAPVRALQLVVTALSGGTLTVNILQGLSIN